MNLFDVWNQKKQKLHKAIEIPGFEVGQIWWVQFGKNVGTEILGKGDDFLRPAVVFRALYSGTACLVIPLTGRKRLGDYYFNFYDSSDREQCTILPQIRYIDSKRLKRFHSRMKKQELYNLEQAFNQFMQQKNNPQPRETGGAPKRSNDVNL